MGPGFVRCVIYIYTTAERAVIWVKKVTYFGGIWLPEHFMYKYYFNVVEFLER